MTSTAKPIAFVNPVLATDDNFQRIWNELHPAGYAVLCCRPELITIVPPPDKPLMPRVRNLPEFEQGPFTEYLASKARPEIEGDAVQDAFYPHDYEAWKEDAFYKATQANPSLTRSDWESGKNAP